MLQITKRLMRLLRPIYWPFVKGYFWFISLETRGVRVVLTHQGEILLVMNSYGLKYNFPGGSLGKSEDPESGAKREIREELGISVKELKFLGNIVPPKEFEYRKNTISVFTTELPSKELSINSLEISDYKWCSPNELPSMGHVAYEVYNLYKSKIHR